MMMMIAPTERYNPPPVPVAVRSALLDAARLLLMVRSSFRNSFFSVEVNSDLSIALMASTLEIMTLTSVFTTAFAETTVVGVGSVDAFN